MNETPRNRLERALEDAGRALEYPPTPDLVAVLRPRRPGQRSRPPAARRLLWAAVLLLLALAGLAASPEARAGVRELFRLGAVRIVPREELAATPPVAAPLTPAPVATALPPVALRDLAGATTLDALRETLPFPLRLPTYPASLGEPDQVFLQQLGGAVVVLAWLDPENPGEVALSLHVLENEAIARKGGPVLVQETSVGGQPALWTEGPYPLEYLDAQGRPQVESRRMITGNVLIWTDGALTYRLESDLPLAEARRIAESLR
jgi:hypothetical protein